jgi:hypothetical protein
MAKPSLGALLLLKPKGGSEEPRAKPGRRKKVQTALRAAFKAAKEDDEEKFVDAVEGALGFSQESDDEGA